MLSNFFYSVQAVLKTALRFFKRLLGKNYFISASALGKWTPEKAAWRNSDLPTLWLDAFSGGEVTQIVSLCKKLKEQRPGLRLIVSTNNRYAAEFTRTLNPHVDLVIDSPWDIVWVARRFLHKIQPDLLVFVENCSLPLVSREAQKLGVPTTVVSALVREEFRTHPIYRRPFGLHFERYIDEFFVKAKQDADTLQHFGVPPQEVLVQGDLKWDLDYLRLDSKEKASLRSELGLHHGERLIVGGSLHPGEVGLAVEAFQTLFQKNRDWRLVLVPRYPEKLMAEVSEVLATDGLEHTLLTELGNALATPVLTVDSFGKLGKIYQLAEIALLGGSFYRRNPSGTSQNLIEPVLAGCMTFFGPYTSNFQTVADQLAELFPLLRAEPDKFAGQFEEAVRTIPRALYDQRISGVLPVIPGRGTSVAGDLSTRLLLTVSRSVSVFRSKYRTS